MGRWEPNARGRLERAAFELYIERGFAQTTVTEIAKQAGLTERTFFRHFADKREVLFSGSAALQELLVEAVAGAPTAAGPIDAVGAGLATIGDRFHGRRAHSTERQAIIAANTELRERELIKLAALAAATAQTLRGRGVGEPAASLAAEAGVAVFKISFERWIDDSDGRELTELMQEALAELKTVATGG